MEKQVTDAIVGPVGIEEITHGDNVVVYPGAILFPNVELGNNVTIFPGAVVGRPPLSSGATRRVSASEELAPVRIGDGCVIGSNAVIYMGVDIGRNSMICDTACVREGCSIGEYVVIAMGVTVNYDTKIGNRVKVMDNTHLTGNMVIEDDVFVAMLVTTANDNSMGRAAEVDSLETLLGPTIKRFATIGQGACLLAEVSIGENAIVGSNSVVTKDVAPETVVVGAPARRVRALRPDEIRS